MWRQNTSRLALQTSSKQTKRSLPAAWWSKYGASNQGGPCKDFRANTTTGQHTNAMIAKRKEEAKIAKGLRDRLRVIEQNLRRHGIVD